MSRSKRGGKAPGYEYWGTRPNRAGATGKKAKQITHKIERQKNKVKQQELEE